MGCGGVGDEVGVEEGLGILWLLGLLVVVCDARGAATIERGGKLGFWCGGGDRVCDDEGFEVVVAVAPVDERTRLLRGK